MTYTERLISIISSESFKADVKILMTKLIEAKQHQRTIYIFGNGGSGSTASHWANDFTKGMSYGNVPDNRFKMICLNDNMPIISAISNDADYSEIFVEQLKNFLTPTDIVIGISGSGNSMNVVKAFEYANQVGAETIAIVGFDGGKLRNVAQWPLHIMINDMGVFEDVSLIIDHIIFDAYKQGVFK